MESRTSIDLGEVKEKDEIIVIRSTKIETIRDYLNNQLVNINIANAGFLITMIILSASVQSTLNQQQQYNVDTQNLLASVTSANNVLQNSINVVSSQINNLNTIAIGVTQLYNEVIVDGSLFNLIKMNETSRIFADQERSFNATILYANQLISNLQSLNVTIISNNETLSKQIEQITSLAMVDIESNSITKGLISLYSSNLGFCFQDVQTISQGYSILNLCINDPHIIIRNPSSGIVPTTDWENGRGFSCVNKGFCLISGSIQFQTFGSGSGSAQIIMGFNGTSVSNVLLPISLSQNPAVLFPINVNVDQYDILQFIINLSGSTVNYQAQFNYNIFHFE